MLDTHRIDEKTHKSRIAQRVRKCALIHPFTHVRREFVPCLFAHRRENCVRVKRGILSQGFPARD